MELYHHLTPAVLAYKGIQYQYMAPGVFTDMELEYIQQHLRILSGFYGILRPFDGVTPYRLEMQANLSICWALSQSVRILGKRSRGFSYCGNRVHRKSCFKGVQLVRIPASAGALSLYYGCFRGNAAGEID